MSVKTTLKGIINLYNKTYSAKTTSFERNYFWDLKEFSKFVKRGSKVLDAGCGRGKSSDLLPKDYFVTGIDINKKAIHYARKKHKGTKFFVMSLSDLSFKNSSFDAVFCRRVLGDLYRIGRFEKAVKELSRILKKKGIIYATIYLIVRTHFTFEDKKFTVKYVKKEFEKYFKILESRVIYHRDPNYWGKYLKIIGEKSKES